MLKGITFYLNKYKKILILVLCLGGVVFLLHCCWHEEYYIWYTPGPIQVLGNNDELWLFLQFSRQTHKSRRVPYWDVPSTYPIGGFQEIIILTESGLQQRIRLAKKDKKCGVDFHPNISTIFGYKGNIYLYQQGYKESLFQFNENDKRFDLLSIEDGNVILDKILSGTSSINRRMEIQQFSEVDGMSPYYRDSFIGNTYFTWKGILFEIATSKVNDDYFKAIINTVEPNKGYPVVLNYVIDLRHITYKDFKNLSGWEYGHPTEKK